MGEVEWLSIGRCNLIQVMFSLDEPPCSMHSLIAEHYHIDAGTSFSHPDFILRFSIPKVFCEFSRGLRIVSYSLSSVFIYGHQSIEWIGISTSI